MKNFSFRFCKLTNNEAVWPKRIEGWLQTVTLLPVKSVFCWCLGASKKFRKIKIYYYLRHACLSVRRIFVTFHTWVFFFRKSVEEIQIWLKYDKNSGYFTRRPVYMNDNISLKFFPEWNIFFRQTCTENESIRPFTTLFPPQNGALYVMWENNVQQGKATYDNMEHAHCMLHT